MKNPSGAQPAGACRPRAKTAAERQRDYRARKKQGLGYAGSAVRLDMFLAYEQDVQLGSLLRHFKKLHGNISKKELIERLIRDEYSRRVNDFPHDLFQD